MVSTQVVTTLDDNPSRPVLQFVQFIAQSNVGFVPNRTTVIKMGPNKRIKKYPLWRAYSESSGFASEFAG